MHPVWSLLSLRSPELSSWQKCCQNCTLYFAAIKKSYINTAIIHKSYWCHQFDGNMYFLCSLHIAMHTMQCTQCTQCTLCTQLVYSRWRCQDIAVSWPLCFPPLHKLHNMYSILGVSVTFNGRKWKHYCSLEDMCSTLPDYFRIQLFLFPSLSFHLSVFNRRFVEFDPLCGNF